MFGEEANKSEEAKGTRYYLHLPKIAYTLARLPREVLKDDDFRQSLKNPYNALYFRAIALAIKEDDALGGHGSRGYGSVLFGEFPIYNSATLHPGQSGLQ
uniref:hypothetical protein n=1 Tax=Hassallia byssoidea TaxID=482630 RepID=UPI00058490C5|nr:hypothetical protein [Hassalia byssoidea]